MYLVLCNIKLPYNQTLFAVDMIVIWEDKS